MELQVRKIVRHVEELFVENGRPLASPHRVAIAAAVIANPFGAGYIADLVSIADELGEPIGRLLGPECVRLLDDDVEAFGKVALVGLGGEVEHGSALIHNLRFGNVFREAAGGTELLPAAEKVGAFGSSIDVPLKHKTDAKTRSHHQTVTFRIEDAPRADEIIVGCVAANSGRPLARLAVFGAEAPVEVAVK
ncbi:amino acid synthesis family protein [Gordonia desulfuricans]|uniref:Amino acid synthesis family protein n=1 Tax=Gordonia desulfuricans TaxID=89051 RepID=A0A7K3LN09_9ACTN|nr:amino acid synthesis family protein [Gordonia desulfuricans]NDK89636.1 amino acid synthesis family protein [Gordonia desulfuricans]